MKDHWYHTRGEVRCCHETRTAARQCRSDDLQDGFDWSPIVHVSTLPRGTARVVLAAVDYVGSQYCHGILELDAAVRGLAK